MAPSWLDPLAAPGPATRGHASERLRYAVRVPDGWEGPELRELPTHLEELFAGGSADGLLVQHMDGADPAADLAGWAQAPLHLTGAPAVSLALAGAAPETLAWDAVEAPTTLAGRFRAEEVRLFRGLVRTADGALGRVYAVLARRGTLAWNAGLSLASAVPPDAPLELVERDDDARAAAILGALELQ